MSYIDHKQKKILVYKLSFANLKKNRNYAPNSSYFKKL